MYDDNSRKYGALSYTVDCISVGHKNKPASVWQGACVRACLFVLASTGKVPAGSKNKSFVTSKSRTPI